MTGQKKQMLFTETLRFGAMLVGCCLYALGVDCFLVHNEIVGGGASGIATLVYLLTDGMVGIGVVWGLVFLILGLVKTMRREM